MTINRVCASGADAVGTAARAVSAGELDLAIAGGVESMTHSPFVMAKPAHAWTRSAAMEDSTIGWRFVNPAMAAAYGTDSMPETAENVAQAYGISREAQDAFAYRSQQRAAAAAGRGYFADEIVALEARQGNGTNLVSTDEHPRPDTALERLAALDPIVGESGTVTAGNSSGINDGSAALLIASDHAIAQFGLTPTARILGMATAGVERRVMGIGPVPAVQKPLGRLRMSLADFDLIELNEAFASQVIASLLQLGIDPTADFVNPNGGAIALGHPLGMSGARLIQTAIHGLHERGGRRAMVALCVGVRQGVAVAIDRP